MSEIEILTKLVEQLKRDLSYVLKENEELTKENLKLKKDYEFLLNRYYLLERGGSNNG